MSVLLYWVMAIIKGLDQHLQITNKLYFTELGHQRQSTKVQNHKYRVPKTKITSKLKMSKTKKKKKIKKKKLCG